MILPTFKGVGEGSTLSIQGFKLSGESIFGDGTENIQVFDTDSNVSDTYMWFKEDMMGLPDGWYNDSFEKVDVSFNPGEGFLLYLGNGSGEITFSGEVAAGEVEISVVQGINVSGNCTPVNMNVQSLALLGENVMGDGTENIQVLDADSNVSDTYMWFKEDMMGLPDGWYNDSFEKVDVEIGAGSGFFLYLENGAATFAMPGAL